MTTFPLDVTTELLLDGTWTDITSSVFQRDPIQITRGRADESATVDPSRCSLTIDNRSGDFSPRNPVGAHFGLIGRNTQLRVLTPTGLDNYMVVPGGPELIGSVVSYASTPDAAALDITGDLDVRIDLEPDSWRPPDTILTFDDVGLARKYVTDNNQRSWALLLKTDGTLEFTWSDDGTDAGDTTVVSTVAVPEASTRLAVRVTLDVNNGAAGNDVVFYTAPSIDGSWTQLGATVTTAGVTSVFASTAAVEVGRADADDSFGVPGSPMQGKVYAFELRSGIGGSAVANPDFRAQDSATTSFADAAGLTWTLNNLATIANPDARFHGEVSAWPQKWDPSDSDVYAPVEAFGILRRLGQGATPLKSSLFRDLSARDEVVAYFPLEEPKGATRFGSGRVGDTSFLTTTPASAVKFAADDDTFVASEALPTVGDGTIYGSMPSYVGAAEQRFVVLVSIPADVTWGSDKLLARVYTTGSVKQWDLIQTSADTMRMRAYDSGGTLVVDNGPFTMPLFGIPCALSLLLIQTTATSIDWQVGSFPLDQTIDPTFGGTTVAGSHTFGRFDHINLGSADDVESTTFGHAFVLNDDVNSMWDIIGTSMIGWSGESATDRIVRLCHQEGLPVAIIGDVSDGAALGPQLPTTLLELLREAAAADLGVLYEPREFLGLAYRTRASLYSQDAALALNYAAGHLSSIEPVEDDQASRNDITVKRQLGTSARVELTSGPLSTLAPPNGIGRYDESVTISLSTDDDLAEQASWRLHLGTVDEARYPVLGVNLATDVFTGSATLTADAQGLDLGDKITVADLPAWMPPDDVSQIAQGFSETLTRYQWIIAVNCSPGSVWDVGVWDEDEGPGEARYSSDGSTLAEDLTTTETAIDVATPSGLLWGDDDAPYDIVVGGERMTVTAVAGTSSPQTFTVVRSVNQISKTHATGADVALYKPARFAL